MAFSGGGSNILKPHTHDSTILQDGGNLNFQNVTQSNMSAGSMTQSDGVHLQELAIGTPNQIIRTNAGATAAEWHSPIEIGEELVNKGSIHGCTGGSVQTELLVSATDGDLLQADSVAASGLSYTSPRWKLLATYSGVSASQTITISPAVDLETDFAEIIVVANLYTNSAAGFGEILIYFPAVPIIFSNPYGYSFDSSPALTAMTNAGNYHTVGSAAMTTTGSGFHSVTHIAMAKTATTTDTVYIETNSISDQNRSEKWANTSDIGGSTLSQIQFHASSATWGTGSNISVYGVTFS